MKYIKFSVKEAEFTFLKQEIGLDNMEEMFRPVVLKEMERRNYETNQSFEK